MSDEGFVRIAPAGEKGVRRIGIGCAQERWDCIALIGWGMLITFRRPGEVLFVLARGMVSRKVAAGEV